jgi:DNA-binding NtrC family response regulator
MPAELPQEYRVDPEELPSDAVIFGSTQAMQAVRGKLECVLNNDLPVLLEGECGTGKDLVARYLHSRSSRGEMPFVKLSCAATPVEFLEGALLGYEEESFPGANDIRQGLVDIANGGTLFLDEIGETSWAQQSKLLHLLQEGRYLQVDRLERQDADVRIVCATSINLAEAVARGTFRKDLFYCIDAISFRLPALRERKEDIPQLWEFFTRKLARRLGKDIPQLTPAVLSVLNQWNWPGNLLELENCIARVIVLGDEAAICEELMRHLNQIKVGEELNWNNRSLSYGARDSVAPERQRRHRRFPRFR